MQIISQTDNRLIFSSCLLAYSRRSLKSPCVVEFVEEAEVFLSFSLLIGIVFASSFSCLDNLIYFLYYVYFMYRLIA